MTNRNTPNIYGDTVAYQKSKVSAKRYESTVDTNSSLSVGFQKFYEHHLALSSLNLWKGGSPHL
jgi:hypothetical protein